MECLTSLVRKHHEPSQRSKPSRRRSTVQKVRDRSRLYARVTYRKVKDAITAVQDSRRQSWQSRSNKILPEHEAEKHRDEDDSTSDRSNISNSIWQGQGSADEPFDEDRDYLMCMRAGIIARQRRQQKPRPPTPPWLKTTTPPPPPPPRNPTIPRHILAELNADVLALLIKHLSNQRADGGLDGEQVRIIRLARQALCELPDWEGREGSDNVGCENRN
jgi:hypothetical protein